MSCEVVVWLETIKLGESSLSGVPPVHADVDGITGDENPFEIVRIQECSLTGAPSV
jgi:hypothetical protein